MPVGKRKRLDICRECKHANRPAIMAARLGHAGCLATAYRELGVFNERDDFGATPIHFAARNGHLECLKWLVTRSGVSPNAVARNGATAAHDAAAMGHLACLHYLLENTACSSKDATVEGATALHMACRFGRLKVVKWLMDYTGASPGEKGANDVTPVHLCAAKSKLVNKRGGADDYTPMCASIFAGCRSFGVSAVVDKTPSVHGKREDRSRSYGCLLRRSGRMVSC